MKKLGLAIGTMFALPSVFASQIGSSMLLRMTEILRFFFVTLNGPGYREMYYKLLIWLLIFTLLKYGANLLLKGNAKTANIIALIVSLMSTLLIPVGVLEFIVFEYSFVVGMVLIFLPTVIGYLIARNIEMPMLKGAIYILIAIFALAGAGTLVQEFGAQPPAADIAEAIAIGAVILIIAGLLTIFSGGLASSGALGSLGGSLGNALGKLGSGLKSKNIPKISGSSGEPTPAAEKDDEELAQIFRDLGGMLDSAEGRAKEIFDKGQEFLNAFVDAHGGDPKPGDPVPDGFEFPQDKWNEYHNAVNNFEKGKNESNDITLQKIENLFRKIKDKFAKASDPQREEIKKLTDRYAELLSKLIKFEMELTNQFHDWNKSKIIA